MSRYDPNASQCLQGEKPRMFRMTPNAAAWIKWAWDGKGRICKSVKQVNWIMDDVAKKLKIDLPRNGGRHTFITMHVAAFERPETTDNMTGTSSRMRATHYQGLVTKTEGEKFFAIMPTVKAV